MPAPYAPDDCPCCPLDVSRVNALSRVSTQPAVLNAQTGEELTGPEVEGVLAFKRPWPSLTRTVYGDHQRYLDVYLRPYKVRWLGVSEARGCNVRRSSQSGVLR